MQPDRNYDSISINEIRVVSQMLIMTTQRFYFADEISNLEEVEQ